MSQFFYLAAIFITNVGHSCAFIILGKYSLDYFGIASVFGAILLIEQLKALSLSFLGGHMSDRFGARTMAITCDLTLFLTIGVLGTLTIYGYEKFGILAVAVIINLAKPIYSPALFAFLREIVPLDSLRQLNARSATVQQIGWLAGLGIASWGLTKATPGEMILVNAGTYFFSGVFLSLCQRMNKLEDTKELTVSDENTIYKKIRLMASSRSFIWMFIIGVQVNLIIAYNVGIFPMVAKNFPLYPAYLSYFEIIYALSVATIAAFGGKGLHLKNYWMAFLFQGVILGLLPHFQEFWISCVLIMLFGISSALIFPFAFDQLYRSTEGERLGSVGANKGIIQALIAIPLLIGVNILLDGVGIESAYFLMAMTSGAIALVPLLPTQKKESAIQ